MLLKHRRCWLTYLTVGVADEQREAALEGIRADIVRAREALSRGASSGKATADPVDGRYRSVVSDVDQVSSKAKRIRDHSAIGASSSTISTLPTRVLLSTGWCAAHVAANSPVYRSCQRFKIERLRHDQHHAFALEALAHAAHIRVGARQEHRYLGAVGYGSARLDERVTIHVRHVQVDDHQRGRSLTREHEALTTAIGDVNVKILTRQHASKHLRQCDIVVDDQHARTRTRFDMLRLHRATRTPWSQPAGVAALRPFSV